MPPWKKQAPPDKGKKWDKDSEARKFLERLVYSGQVKDGVSAAIIMSNWPQKFDGYKTAAVNSALTRLCDKKEKEDRARQEAKIMYGVKTGNGKYKKCILFMCIYST